MDVEIRLDRSNASFDTNEKVKGVVVVNCPGTVSHSGVTMQIEGAVSLQLNPKSAGIFETYYTSLKPYVMVSTTVKLLDGSGKFQVGETRIPFEFDLQILKRPNVPLLLETYHGVFINSSYYIHVSVSRGMFAKDIKTSEQLYVRSPGQGLPPGNNVISPVTFTLQPTSVKNVRKVTLTAVPEFRISGHINTTSCDITRAISGTVRIEQCDSAIKSLEIQLVRVEYCAAAEGVAKEATEIQNIQIGEGDVVRNYDIPIFMMFPRWFTCATLVSPHYKVEFEVNIVVLLEDNHQITENVPIRLYRPLVASTVL